MTQVRSKLCRLSFGRKTKHSARTSLLWTLWFYVRVYSANAGLRTVPPFATAHTFCASRVWRAFLESPENFSDPKSDPKSSRNHFLVFLEAHENFGPEKNRVISPRKFTGGQRVPKIPFFFREKFCKQNGGCGGSCATSREKK